MSSSSKSSKKRETAAMMLLKDNSGPKRMHFGEDYDRHVTVVEVAQRTKLGAELFLLNLLSLSSFN